MQHTEPSCIEPVMKRFAAHSLVMLGLLSGVSACSAGRGLLSKSSKSSPVAVPAAAKSASAAKPASVPPAPGLSEYATRFIRDTNALAEICPPGPTAAPSFESECVWRADAAERLHKSVEEKAHPQVAKGLAYLGELRKSIATWRAADKDREAQQVAQYKASQSNSQAEREASDLIGKLRAARAGKVEGMLTSFEHRDAEYVEMYLGRLRKEMPALERLAKSCASGAGDADKDLCDLAVNREKYFTAMQLQQFDAIIGEHLKAWAEAVDGMKRDGQTFVPNYNTFTKPEKLKELGGELAAIGKVLSQPNPAAKIDSQLNKLRDEFIAAVRARHNTNAWAEHASEAKFQDPRVTKAVKAISGLTLVRVGANAPNWAVIRGNLDQPIKRERGIWALMKKPGDAFCRLYQFTVVEPHMGGGKYGDGSAESFGVPQFYVSACK